jgi:hypothetical protein
MFGGSDGRKTLYIEDNLLCKSIKNRRLNTGEKMELRQKILWSLYAGWKGGSHWLMDENKTTTIEEIIKSRTVPENQIWPNEDRYNIIRTYFRSGWLLAIFSLDNEVWKYQDTYKITEWFEDPFTKDLLNTENALKRYITSETRIIYEKELDRIQPLLLKEKKITHS